MFDKLFGNSFIVFFVDCEIDNMNVYFFEDVDVFDDF